MKNKSLVNDYIIRAEHRLAAVNVLVQRKSWADVVRESQEIVELCLKALLRSAKIAVPQIHDVGKILKEEISKLPKKAQPHVAKLAKISHKLRRDRELAFYGSEDLTPSDFYEQKDGESAFEEATWVYRTVASIIK